MATAERTLNTAPAEPDQTCFRFEGVDILGNTPKKQYVFALDESDAEEKLSRARIRVDSIQPKSDPFARRRKTLTRTQLGSFSIQLGERAQGNQSIPNAIQDMARSTNNPLLREALNDVWDELRNQSVNIDQALAVRDDVFPEAFRQIIHVGLEKGDPGPMLIKYGNRQLLTAENIGKVKGALIYPSVVMGLASLIVVALTYYVIPSLVQMYDALLQQSGASQLPLVTRVLLGISTFLTSRLGMLTMILVVVGIVFTLRWLKSNKGKDWFQRHSIHWPLIGPLVRQFNAAHVVDLMGILADALTPTKFLEEAAAASLNVVYRETLIAIREGFREGGLDLTTAFSPYSYYFGNDFQIAISTGEKTGNLSNQLRAYADMVDKRVKESTERLTKLIEPLTICAAGLAIGFIVLGAYWPLFDLVGKLANKN